MQVVDADFLAEQNANEQKYYNRTVLYRKTWNGSEYVLDSGTNIDSYIKSIGKISNSSDENFQTFKTDNLDITVKNDTRQWGRVTPSGFWDGFIPEFSEIKIEFGYVDSSSVEHGLIIFHGVLTADAVREDINNKTAVIHVRGYAEIPDRESAEDLADNQRTGIALLGNVNGVNTTFTTSDNGVGIIKAVYLDGVKFVVNDYTVSVLNDASNPATVEMDLPPASGSMTADYVFWYQDKTIGFLIEQLIEHAGITNHDIEEVIFPNSVIQTVKYDTKTEFDETDTVKENVYTETGDDRLFAGIINHSELPDYSVGIYLPHSVAGGPYQAQSFKPKITISAGQSTLCGFDITSKGGPGGAVTIRIWVSPDNAGEPNEGVRYGQTDVNFVGIFLDYLKFQIADFGIDLTAGTTYWLVWEIVDSGTWIWTNRSNNGSGSYVDGTGMTKAVGGGWVNLNEDFMFFIKPDYNINWMSDTVDTGGTLVSWGQYTANTSPSGIFALYTRSQAADSGWPGSFVAVDWEIVTGGTINSDLERFIRFAVVITYTPTKHDFFPTSIPYINELKLIYNTSTFLMNLANFTGLSIKGAIEDLALMSDYQFGFKTDGKFFFRPKGDSSAIDMEIFGVTKILNYRPDWDRLKNYVTANFGSYSKVVSSITEGDTAPTSINKYGLRKMDVSGGNILDDDSIDIATGAAEVYYKRYKDVKRRARVSTKIIPQLEVGDIVRLKYLAGGVSIMMFNGYVFDGYTFADDIDMLDPYDMAVRIMKIDFDIEKINRNGGMILDILEV